MPNTSEGFDQVEASASPEHAVNVVKFESVQSDPAPRRRRGGRRVVSRSCRLRNLRMIPVIPLIPRV